MNLLIKGLQFGFSKLLISIGYLLWSLKLSKIHIIRVFEKERFKFVHYGDIARVLYAYQGLVSQNMGFEYSTLKRYDSMISKDFVVLDIGANVGLFSLIASKKVGDDGRIYAFEPIKKTFEVLCENIRINNFSNIVPTQLALSNFTGEVSFSIPSDVKNKADGDAFNSMDFSTSSSIQDVSACTKLDSFVAEYNIRKVDIIKIDIEGAELLCFEGAVNLLSSENPPTIIMECSDSLSKRFNYTIFDVLTYLSKFGYTFEQYDYNQWIASAKPSKVS